MQKSNFKPCCEPEDNTKKTLGKGYRIAFYSRDKASASKAEDIKTSYEELGYKNCAVLTPKEVLEIDHHLAEFVAGKMMDDEHWNDENSAAWVPGGCISTRDFLPQLTDHLKNKLPNFEIKHECRVTEVFFDNENPQLIAGIKYLENNEEKILTTDPNTTEYVFCPGEEVFGLKKLGFTQPPSAGFAGVALSLEIPLSPEEIHKYSALDQNLDFYENGVGCAWQIRFKDEKVHFSLAGTKGFYGDQKPAIDEPFAQDRLLVLFNMMNHVFPDLIRIALKENAPLDEVTPEQLKKLTENNIANCWVGRRAVAADGFPSWGPLYWGNMEVLNGRCNTGLSSGGVAFAPVAALVSNWEKNASILPKLLNLNEEAVQKLLAVVDDAIKFGTSCRLQTVLGPDRPQPGCAPAVLNE
jgi:hypothetical protein